MILTLKNLKPITAGDRLLHKFIKTTRTTEVYTPERYNKAEDGLPKKIVEKENWD